MKKGGHFWNDEYDKSWYNYSPVGGVLMGEIITFCNTHFESNTSKKRKAEDNEEPESNTSKKRKAEDNEEPEEGKVKKNKK